MPAPRVHSRRTQNNGHARGHVFAAVLAHAFDHCESAAVSHRKAFAYPARDIEFSAGRAVEQGVAREHIAPQRGFSPRR